MNKERIIHVLPGHRTRFTSIQSEEMYVRDYKHHDLKLEGTENRGVVIESCPDPEWDSVVIYNAMADKLAIDFDSFPENALPEEEAGKHASQCECVLFPADGSDEDWVLFIETKYTPSAEIAQRDTVNYPAKMFSQIKSTVEYFRRRGILPSERKVHAIMSFPKLLEPFDGWAFPVVIEDKKDGNIESLSVEDILSRYKIHIRSTNHALIRSPKRIILGKSKQR